MWNKQRSVNTLRPFLPEIKETKFLSYTMRQASLYLRVLRYSHLTKNTRGLPKASTSRIHRSGRWGSGGGFPFLFFLLFSLFFFSFFLFCPFSVFAFFPLPFFIFVLFFSFLNSFFFLFFSRQIRQVSNKTSQKTIMQDIDNFFDVLKGFHFFKKSLFKT